MAIERGGITDEEKTAPAACMYLLLYFRRGVGGEQPDGD
jgi:hypothetical protein